MRRIASLLLPLLVLSACYGGQYAGTRAEDSRYSNGRWYGHAEGPLVARLTRSGTGLGVDLSAPAYVAVFQILPGRGVGLYYPSYQPEAERFAGGFNMLPTHGAQYFDSYFTAMPVRYYAGEPTFFLLIASRQPLRSIARFQHSDGAIRSALGLSAYTTLNYRRVMDDLIETVVPPQNDDDWTTDVLPIWPNEGGSYAYDGYTRVYCGDGYSLWIPVELAQWACWGRDRSNGTVRRVPATTPPGHGQDGDTSSVNRPGRHRPEPPPPSPAAAAERERWAKQPRRAEPQDPNPRQIDTGSSTQGGSRRPGEQQPAEHPQVDQPRAEHPRPERPAETPRVETPRSEPRSQPAPRYDPPPQREPAPSPPPRAEAPAPRVEAPSRPADPPSR